MTEPPVVGATTPDSAAPAVPPASAPPAQPPATPPAAAPPAAAPPQGQDGATPPKQTPPDATASTGAPESYSDFKLPEGMALNQAALDKFLPLAREMNLSQEKAQQMVDLFAEQIGAIEQGSREAWERQKQEWTEAVRKDPELGGANYDATLQHSQTFVARFGDAELQTLLDEYGVGSHPALVRAFARAGKAAAEDTFPTRGDAGSGEDTLEARAMRMFPNSLRKQPRPQN